MSLALLDRPAVHDLLRGELSRRHLADFCERMDPRYTRARHSDLLIEHLEAVERGDIRRLMVFEPPRHSKTYHTSERFPAWFLGRHPTAQLILGSYGADLAERASRKVRNLLRDERWPFPGVGVADDSAAVNRWATNQGGTIIAAGVDGAMTGFGADLLIIDDPVKGRKEADSETYRETAWEWYTEVARTRLMPGGRIVLCQCMTGDTPVRMADGTERDLKDIRAGDMVASYRDGRIVGSRVLRWANQGPDYVFAIRMNSGIIVRANERHPFLVDRGGELEWVRLKSLRTGDTILRVTGVSGAAPRVPTRVARNQRSARGTAPLTTTRRDGRVGNDLLRSMPHIAGTPISNTDMASVLTSTRPSLPSRAGAALYAESYPARTSALTGAESSVLTTATLPARSEDCSVTTATSSSDTERPSGSYSRRLGTFEILPDTIVAIESDGREDVFDIQVEGTENFIANGLVSHNTRWHEDDLAGRLLNSQNANQWTVLNLPALAERSDPMGRTLGEPLWPEWFDVDALDEIRGDLTNAQGSRAWLALYQQSPTAAEGGQFKRAWFAERWDREPETDLRIMALDAAYKTGVANDYSAIVTAGVAGASLPVLDVRQGRWEYPELKRELLAAADDLLPHAVLIEDTAAGQSILQELRQTVPLNFIPVKVSASKEARAAAVAPTCEAGRVVLPRHGRWVGPLVDQLAAFPSGQHDDMVDAFVHAISYLAHHTALARRPRSRSLKVT